MSEYFPEIQDQQMNAYVICPALNHVICCMDERESLLFHPYRYVYGYRDIH
jgi:hypothetical protein